MDRLKGILLWWSRNSHVGVIFHPDSEERFFIHIGRIVKGPVIPEPDSECLFYVDPRPAAPGKLRAATNVEILPKSQTPVSTEKVEAKTGGAL